MKSRKNELNYILMLLPGLIFLFIFSYIPMGGIVIAFQKFNPAKGIFKSRWIGFENFIYMFQLPDIRQVFTNTIIIACAKIILSLIVPIMFALLLNEVRKMWFKKAVQTIVYLPHFLSWVILSSILINMLSIDGIINQIVQSLFGEPIMFLTSNFWFRLILVITDQWKEFGYGTIIYLAALSNINPVLYEAANIDGASRFQLLTKITLPGITSTITLLSTLSLGRVLNAGFDQIINLYNPLVYETADILDTYVYRFGLVNAQYGLATAIGILQSIVSLILIVISYKLADKYANYKIF